MSQTDHTAYRPDVDGLRAIAVGSVVLFHAFPTRLPGGYVGVDVFFAISGYLISRLIFEALHQGRFSYLDFYERRVRRIFPALLVVLAATIIGGAYILLPREYKDLGRQAAAGMGFVANFLFYSETGYFDAAHQLKPLLHLWSLGVEEQFYITWPLLLALLYPRTRRLAWIIGGLALLSFGWNLYSLGKDPAATFYLPMSRYWELMLGALLSYRAVFNNSQASAAQANLLALFGLLLIGAALIFFNERMPFPGWRAALPTVGACCLIAAEGSWINRRLLANRLAVGVGLISYPLYLWHWVLLCFLQHRMVWQASHAQVIAAVLVSVLLAWLTYQFVEKPLRFGRRLSTGAWARMPIRASALASLAVVVVAAGMGVYFTQGAVFRYPDQIRRLATYNYDAKAEYREGLCQLSGERPFSELSTECIDAPKANSRLLVLWGDSHASSLYQGLRTALAQVPDLRMAQFTASGCPPLLGVRLGRRKSCLEFNQDAFDRIAQLKPDIVVVEGWWDAYGDTPEAEAQEMSALRSTVQRLADAQVKHIVLVGDLPLWAIWEPDAQIELWRATGQIPERTFRFYLPIATQFDTLVRTAVADSPAEFISPIATLCNADGCLLNTDADQTPITWDGAHLTAAGSRLLVSTNVSKFLALPEVASR